MSSGDMTEYESIFSNNKEKIKYFYSWSLWYPDLFLDLAAPKEGKLILHLDQRVFMRSDIRFFSMYGCFPRGYGKTFDEVVDMFVIALHYPNITLALSAQTKENSAALLRDKYNEILRYYPFFENEIVKANFNQNVASILFRNGAKIDNLANAQTSKGQRRHRLREEESALMDNDTYEDAMEPIVEVGRVTSGKLALNNPQELNQQINYYTTPYMRGSDEFSRSLKMVDDMINCKGKIVLGSDWMLPCWYGRGSSKEQILLKKKNSSPIFFAVNYGGKWVGTLSGALVNVNKLLNCRTLTAPILQPESNEDEFYMGVDVARSEKTSNNQSSIAIGRVVREEDGRIKNVELANLINISNTYNFETQACIIKRIRARYNAKMVAVDGNGLGAGLIDKLMEETYDPKTGEFYPCWNTVNTDAKPHNEKTCLDCLFDMKATGVQTQVISTFINMVDSERFRFLENRKESDFNLRDSDDITSKVMPYVQEELFFQEVCNLKLKQVGKRLEVERETPGLDKDRWSAVSYLLYYIDHHEGVFENGPRFDSKRFTNKIRTISRRPIMY